jgi:hypothetical protein
MEIHIQLRLEEEFPDPEELSARHQLEDALEEEGIGSVVDAGAGGGVMDIYVEVKDAAAALPEIHRLLEEHGWDDVAKVSAVKD